MQIQIAARRKHYYNVNFSIITFSIISVACIAGAVSVLIVDLPIFHPPIPYHRLPVEVAVVGLWPRVPEQLNDLREMLAYTETGYTHHLLTSAALVAYKE